MFDVNKVKVLFATYFADHVSRRGGLAGRGTLAQAGTEREAGMIGQVPPRRSPTEPAPVGGKLSGDHYYRVTVAEPISPEVTRYVAECADIIEALGMTFNEGEAFKAIWRLAARRQGRGKVGGSAQYDADKAAHYGARVAAQTRREGK